MVVPPWSRGRGKRALTNYYNKVLMPCGCHGAVHARASHILSVQNHMNISHTHITTLFMKFFYEKKKVGAEHFSRDGELKDSGKRIIIQDRNICTKRGEKNDLDREAISSSKFPLSSFNGVFVLFFFSPNEELEELVFRYEN